MIFTQLPIHLKILIAVFCDHDTFFNLCSAYNDLQNLYFGKISKRTLRKHGNLSELMYSERCQYWFPTYCRFKDDKFSWYKTYFNFYLWQKYKFNADYCCEFGMLSELKLCHAHGEIMTFLNANKAASNGHIHILEWLHSINVDIDSDHIKYIIANAKLRVLQWLKKNNLFVLPTTLSYMVFYYDIEFLEFLSNEGMDINSAVLDRAIVYCDIETLKWFEKRGILLSQVGINNAILNDKVNLLKWINKRQTLTNESFEFAKKHEKKHVLRYLNSCLLS